MNRIALVFTIAAALVATSTAQISFSPPSAFPSGIAGGAAEHIVAVDLIGDRYPELVVVDDVTNQLAIHTNLGGGLFSLLTVLTTGASPKNVISADVNGDGHNDLIVANSGSNDLTLIINYGGGSFAAGVSLAVGTAPMEVIATDVNGDGLLDLATANSGSADMSVLLNFGSSIFSVASHYATTAGSAPRGLAAGDFNGDGEMDVAVVNRNTGNVSIMTNNGGGTFGETATVPTGTSFATGIVTDDINGDGLMDFVATSFLPPNLVYGQNTGFAWIPNISSDGVHIVDVAKFDADFDGDTDLVTGDAALSNTRIIENVNGVLMGSGVTIATGAVNAVLTADLDGDFIKDIAVARGGTNDIGVSLNTLPENVLGECAVSRLDDGAGGVFDMLAINGSTGGVKRRVDAMNNTMVSFEAAQPPTMAVPAPFLIWAQILNPTLSTVTDLGILDLGDLCIQPSSLYPNAPAAFLFTNNFGGNDPAAATQSTSAPWVGNFMLPPFTFAIAVQGLSVDGPASIKVTNGVLLNVN